LNCPGTANSDRPTQVLVNVAFKKIFRSSSNLSWDFIMYNREPLPSKYKEIIIFKKSNTLTLHKGEWEITWCFLGKEL
jgi:hypothetical protein